MPKCVCGKSGKVAQGPSVMFEVGMVASHFQVEMWDWDPPVSEEQNPGLIYESS